MSRARRGDFGEYVPPYAPIIYSPRQADWIEPFPGCKLLLRVRSKEVAGCYGIVEAIAAPGCGCPDHFHAEDAVFQIISGTTIFTVRGEFVSAPAGTTVVIPAGTPHAWKNRSAAPARMLVTFTPGGIEDMFELLADHPPEEQMRVARRYGTVLVGPPPA